MTRAVPTASDPVPRAIAHSAAIAVQDATDALRHVTTIATTAMGMAMAQFLTTGDARFLQGLVEAQTMLDAAVARFASVTAAAQRLIADPADTCAPPMGETR